MRPEHVESEHIAANGDLEVHSRVEHVEKLVARRVLEGLTIYLQDLVRFLESSILRFASFLNSCKYSV